MSKKKHGNKADSAIRAKLRKRLFVAHVTNSKADTFCNYTKSAQKVFPHQTEGSAKNSGSEYMRDPYVLSEIERVIEEAGIGFSDRVTTLRSIIHGEASREALQLVKDPETGQWKEIVKHIVQPTFTERVNAMKVLNQMDGTDKRASTIVDQRNKLLTKMRKTLLKDLKKARDEVLSEKSMSKVNEAEKIDSEQSSEELEAFILGVERGDV